MYQYHYESASPPPRRRSSSRGRESDASQEGSFNIPIRTSTAASRRRPAYDRQAAERYTIVGGVCGHTIGTASSQPYEGTNHDFSIPLCFSCLESQRVQDTRAAAAGEYTRERARFEAGEIRRSELRPYQLTHDRARQQYQNTLMDREDEDEFERRERGRPTLHEEARRFAGLDDPEWLQFRRDVGNPDRRARVAPDNRGGPHHRNEEEYRRQSRYCRDSSKYRPGRYAPSDNGEFYDTSGYRQTNVRRVSTRSRSPAPRETGESSRREESRRRRREREEEEREQRHLDRIYTDDELQARLAELRKSLGDFS